MQKVVSNSSVLIHLAKIGKLELLKEYFHVIMPFINRIELDPKVCNGKPIIRGTRIPVSVILDQIAAGESWDTIIGGYPELSREDIQAAVLYASAVLEHTEVTEVHA